MDSYQTLYHLLQKYGLCQIIHNYASTGLFLTKSSWKAQIQQHVIIAETCARYRALYNVIPAPIVQNILQTCLVHCGLLARGNSKVLPRCKKLLYILAIFYLTIFIRVCSKCSCVTEDIVTHWLCYCCINDNLRCAILDEYMDKCGFHHYLDTMHHCGTLLYLVIENNQNRLVNFRIGLSKVRICSVPIESPYGTADI